MAPTEFPFVGRRSTAYFRKAVVASSQTLATEAGLRILRQGGTAADAAVAVAAALNVTEPGSTGIGGDAFCIYHDASTGMHAYNGSGRSASALTLDIARASTGGEKGGMDPNHAHCVTVPGAAALWADLVATHGRLSLPDVLAPAIELCEEGFNVGAVSSQAWQAFAPKLRAASPNSAELLIDGEGPEEGSFVRNPFLAETFRRVAAQGAAGFYYGPTAEAIVEVVRSRGGLLTLEDLSAHRTEKVTPINVDFAGYRVHECPPNGQGIVALIALRIIDAYGRDKLLSHGHNSPQYLHVIIEALRLAFADARYFVADPKWSEAPVDALLSKEYAEKRAKLIDETTAAATVEHGTPVNSCDTVYFCVVDEHGNACSFINSTYMPFGSGIVPKGCGFTLQNRGANFVLEDNHPNAAAGGKRPYHTIIPGFLTNDADPSFLMPFGVMGGWMQPQGHVQVLLNMLLFGHKAQEALDAPRICLQPDGTVHIEEGFSVATVEELAGRGHHVRGPVTGSNRFTFGRGQIIAQRHTKDGARFLEAGSDPRGDGVAFGF